MNQIYRLIIYGTVVSSVFLTAFLSWISSGLKLTYSVRAMVSSGLVSNPSNGQLNSFQPAEIQNSPISNGPVDNNNCEVSGNFPEKVRQWCEIISVYASKHGLPPDLVAAIIWQESGGNENAYSNSGAVGLMQVMPKDGIAAQFYCAGGPCFQQRPTTQELKVPEFNVQYGTRMLANLVSKYGNYRDALRYYGPMDVGYYYADKVLKIYQQYGKQIQ